MPDPYSVGVEKVLLIVVLAASCAMASSSLARDRSGSGIVSRGGGANFGSHSLMPKRQAEPEPRKEPSAATGGSAEKREAPKDEKKQPEVKKITTEK